MITLHESNITTFPQDNGIGVLRDVIRAYAEEELNGMFEFYMEYDSEGYLVDELKEERIIKAKAQDKLGYQLFRIYSITKNHENDNLIIRAQHITYDLADNFVESLVANNLTKKQVMELIGSSTVLPHPFNVTSTNTTTRSSTKLYRTNPLQMIGGMEGSILQIWGGQIERDNFNLILHDRRGSDDGVKVTYEKNITGLEATFYISNLVTRIFPFVFIEGSDNEPDRLITVNGKYIDSPHINDYEKIYIKPIDYSHDERINLDGTDTQIRQQLTNIASQYFTETGNDKIKVDMEVQFEHLWETEEYKDLAVLELVGMGDTVTIEHSRLKVNATAIVNYIRYDCIAEKNEEVRLGSVKARLTDSVNKVVDVAEKAEQAQQTANQAIKTANGKNTIYYGPDEPTNGIEGDLWFRVVDGEYTRTYRHDGIQWQLVLSVDVRDAIDEAQVAKNDAQHAIDKATQAIADAGAAFDKAQESLGNIEELREEFGEMSIIVTDNTNNINTLQMTTDRLSVRLEKLDIRGYNFITHLPKLWENGFYGITGIDGMTPGAKYESDQLIRLKDKYRLEPNTDYVLSDHPELAREGHEYIETNLFLHLWNDDGSYSRYLVLNFRNEEHYITFTTSETETQFSLHVMPTDPNVYLTPEHVHNTFFYKLAIGVERTAWTPNLDDTGELVSNVQNFVHDFTITAESLASRISDNEDNITTLTATAQGLQTQVSDIDGNVSNLTQLANALQIQITDLDNYTQSQITQLSDAINLRVMKDDVINQINISDESILIDGKRIHITGQTTIDDASIDGAAIKNASIGNAQIGYIDAAKIATGTLQSIDIYGVTIRGSTIWIDGDRPDFLYTNAIDTNPNTAGKHIYIRPTSYGEVRATITNTIDQYVPMRADSFKAAPLQDAYITTDEMLRVTSHDKSTYRDIRGNVIYGAGFTTTTTNAYIGTDNVLHVVNKGYVQGSAGDPIYRDIRANDIYNRAIITSTTHAYIGTDDELRVVNKGLTGIYRNVRAAYYYGSVFEFNSALGGSHIYIRPTSSGEVRITQQGSTSDYRPIRASSFPTASLAEYKQDIKVWEGSALDIINSATIYDYMLNSDVESGKLKRRYGLVVGEGYNTPSEVIDGDGVEQYLMNSISWKAIQELSSVFDKHDDEINYLKLEVQLLRQKVEQLEEMIA